MALATAFLFFVLLTMASLYTNLAAVYEAMYQQFINYKEEYDFYSRLVQAYKGHSVVELGCGTGHLAAYFVQNGFAYTGLDVSADMLAIAQRNTPAATFLHADMRHFTLAQKADAALITGRTSSYLLTNTDVLQAFSNIGRQLHPSGLLCFDCIDANKFIPLINPTKTIVHTAQAAQKKYSRHSVWQTNPATGFCIDWASVYYEEAENGALHKIGDDHSTIRSFTKEEITLFLQQAGFTVKEMIDRPSYAFDTFVTVAQKIN